ncbi:protein-L-isoaspartate O-methyltransferase [Helicobacter monodelphidis]|nr:protein-L-isoaspartate O-methyltransferase [Helicobacter sp. 15-1451]
MVEEILVRFPVSPEVAKAMANVDRELFISSGMKNVAFKLDALPLAGDQWISSPLTVAKMTHYLETQGADSVLEVGCGSGYQAVVLSFLIRRVFSIERIEKLLLEARQRIRLLGITNINTRFEDGQRGWREFAPYDRILFSAAATRIPEELTRQLAEGGILIAPIVQNNKQIITRFEKHNGIFREVAQLEECVFVPVQDGLVRG